jgi:hypothetical protein
MEKQLQTVLLKVSENDHQTNWKEQYGYFFTPKELEEYVMEKQMEAAEKGFLEGFKVSGEGYNGEYPFEGQTDEYIKEEIKERVIRFLNTNYPKQ